MKKIIVLSIILFISFAVWSQTPTVKVYQVTPDSDTSNNRYCSIASNANGNILIIWRNNVRGMKYYFKKGDGVNEVIAEIPNDLISKADAYKIKWMNVRATQDGIFHAVWCNDIPWPIGIIYAMFNPTTQQWSNPERIMTGSVEDIHLRVSPLNGDLMLGWTWYSSGVKRIYAQFKKNGETAWGNRIKVSSDWATNVMSNFDEEGYLYMAWKQDAPNIIDLIPAFGLLKKDTDGAYKYLGKVVVPDNTDSTVWYFLTSVAAVQRKGFLVGCYEQAHGYYYLPFERKGDAIIADVSKTYWAADCPRRWEFSSMAVPYGEEILFTYKDPQLAIKMKRFKDGKFLNEPAIDLCNNMPSNWLYDSQEDPNIGLLTVWSTFEEPNRIFYSVWDNPLIRVKSAVNVVAAKQKERSFFSINYLYVVTWENNPFNVDKKVNITKFNLYRRTRNSDQNWVLLDSTDPTVFSYTDTKNVNVSSYYEYYVTCLDEKGNESKIL